jgi:hypothetical protein
MRIAICDICHHDKIIVESKWRFGRSNGVSSIRIDACDDHKEWGKELKTVQDFTLAYVKFNES